MEALYEASAIQSSDHRKCSSRSGRGHYETNCDWVASTLSYCMVLTSSHTRSHTINVCSQAGHEVIGVRINGFSVSPSYQNLKCRGFYLIVRGCVCTCVSVLLCQWVNVSLSIIVGRDLVACRFCRHSSVRRLQLPRRLLAAPWLPIVPYSWCFEFSACWCEAL